MRSCSLIAPAKINLYLEIVGDRPDGFHELVMVLQSIALADRIDLKSLGIDTIRVRCDHPEVPDDETNLAYRAAKLMQEQFPDAFQSHGGTEIIIHKHVPVAAGLAGGSSNAAAVLVGLDLLWNLGLVHSELQELGALLGSDVPFCIEGGTVLATGRGEQLSPLPDLEGFYVVLGKYRDLSVSTASAYKAFREQFRDRYVSAPDDLAARRDRVHSGPLVSAIAHQDRPQIAQELHNDLEKAVLPVYPKVAHLRQAFVDAGVMAAMMSGSGPTVFGLTESKDAAEQARVAVQQALDDPNLDLWVTEFCPTGICIAP